MERCGLLFGDVIVTDITDDEIRGNRVKLEVNDDGFLILKKRINGVLRTLTFSMSESDLKRIKDLEDKTDMIESRDNGFSIKDADGEDIIIVDYDRRIIEITDSDSTVHIVINTENGEIKTEEDFIVDDGIHDRISLKDLFDKYSSIPIEKGEGENSIQQKGLNNSASGRASIAQGANDKFYYEKSDGTVVGDIVIQPTERGVSSGEASHTEGVATTASGSYSHAEGGPSVNSSTNYINKRTKATNVGSHAEGIGTESSGRGSHSEGYETEASGYASHAENYRSEAKGKYSHAEGENTRAEGQNSHVEGSGDKSSWGISSGFSSHAEGSTIAVGNYSHSEGRHTKALGESSHAEGQGVLAYGMRAHAEGQDTTSSGQNAHSEGYGDGGTRWGISSGFASHSEGKSSAKNDYAHSEGYETEAEASRSHTEGYRTVTSNDDIGEHAEGKWNKSNPGTIHSIGIGSDRGRKNAIEVMQNGDTYLLGVGGYDGTNPQNSISLQTTIKSRLLDYTQVTQDDDNFTITINPNTFNITSLNAPLDETDDFTVILKRNNPSKVEEYWLSVDCSYSTILLFKYEDKSMPFARLNDLQEGNKYLFHIIGPNVILENILGND